MIDQLQAEYQEKIAELEECKEILLKISTDILASYSDLLLNIKQILETD